MNGRLNLNIKQRSPLITHKPDRLFPQIKERSPLTTSKPDRLFPKSNSDRLNTKKPIAFPQKSNSDRTLNTHKTRSQIPSNQTAIAPHTHKPDRLFPTSLNSDR